MGHFLRGRFFQLHFDLLIGTDTLLCNEVTHCFDEADFVVETGGTHDGRCLPTHCLLNRVRHPGALLDVAALQFLFKFDRVDERASWVLQNDQLVGYDAVNDFLLLALGDVINVAGLVKLGLASMVTLLTVEHLVNTHGFLAAIVLVLGA